MAKKVKKTVTTTASGDCVGSAPTTSPTPNGSWQCRGGQWVWVPEIGA